MRSRRLIWLVPILAAFAWLAWIAWRWQAERQIYADSESPALTITAKHVEALRKLQFTWNTRIESGGPVVDPLAPYGSADIVADLGPIIGTRDRMAVARFHREVSALLIRALHNCDLADGQYKLGHLDNATMQRRLRQELVGLPDARVAAVVAELPRLEPDGSFHFTSQHLRLLHQLRFEWPDGDIMGIIAGSGYPAPAVHFKRPFGDMTAFEIDMAAVLGLPRPGNDHVDPVLNRLYWDMWPALETFVEHVEIDPDASSCASR